MMPHELPALGQLVMVKPRPLHGETKPRRVPDGSRGQMLPDEGGERAFDDYWHDRYFDGSVDLTFARNYPAAPSPAVEASPRGRFEAIARVIDPTPAKSSE